jgi:hypothetical protein
MRNCQTGFLTNFETFLIRKLKYVNTSWRAADNWSESRMRPAGGQLDSPGQINLLALQFAVDIFDCTSVHVVFYSSLFVAVHLHKTCPGYYTNTKQFFCLSAAC